MTRANVTLPPLFSEHAVLQKSGKVPVWGAADPGSSVTVSIAGEAATTIAGADGRWRVSLDLAEKPPGPFVLKVRGTNELDVADVLIGEVWICSGQSNMEWSVSRTIGAESAIAASADPQLRVFEPHRMTSAQPLQEIEGRWVLAGPADTGRFPAVGYYFGKTLRDALKAPVGLISSSWGGTPVESWTSREALGSIPDLKSGSEKVIDALERFRARLGEYQTALNDWERRYRPSTPAPADPSGFADPSISTGDWKPVTLPGSASRAGLPDAGAIWFRRKFHLSREMTIGPLFLELGMLRDFDTVYIDGKKVGETNAKTGGAASPRTYYVEKAKEGEITVTIRLEAPAGGAAVVGPSQAFRIDGNSLEGSWLAKVEYALPPLPAAARGEYPALLPTAPYEFRTPSYVYNSMINPIIPYAIRGVVWYQGEDNAPRAFQYRTAFPLMINDWRARWAQGEFPFYFCQLANYGALKAEPSESAWAELREAQTMTLSLPHTGEAILIDLGEEGDIHPRDKTQVGSRLGRLALGGTYGQSIASSGPTYDSMAIEGGAVRIHFAHAEGGLLARKLPATYQRSTVDPTPLPRVGHSRGGEVEGFAICGEDRKWVWADAKIDGESVLVRAAGVPRPIAVRYAWADSPICNLYNRAGLPAGPFRTDHFPGITEQAKFGL